MSSHTDVISICNSGNEVESICTSSKSTENVDIKNHRIYKRRQMEKTSTTITNFFSVKKGRKRKFSNKKTKEKTTKRMENESNNNRKKGPNDVVINVTDNTEISTLTNSVEAWTTSSFSSFSSKQHTQGESSRKRRNLIDWSHPEYFDLLVQTINEKRRLGKLFVHPPIGPDGIFVPHTTLYNVLRRLDGREATLQNCFPQKKNSFLSSADIIVLQDIVRKRDRQNTGVTRKEAIQIIIDLGQARSYKSAENHLDYLIRANKLMHLKRHGRIVSAQGTTSERCQINKEQQLRWHYLIESEWRFLRATNQPTEHYLEVQKHFQLNLDESCFLCSEGVLKILGDAYRKRHDKNNSDNRVSITTVRIGSAGGSNGPVIFIAVGTKGAESVSKMYRNKRLQRIYGLPPGSSVVCNESAYMDDATWLQIVKIIAPAIREMPHIRDHPKWWVLMTYDGFKSHVNVSEAL